MIQNQSESVGSGVGGDQRHEESSTERPIEGRIEGLSQGCGASSRRRPRNCRWSGSSVASRALCCKWRSKPKQRRFWVVTIIEFDHKHGAVSDQPAHVQTSVVVKKAAASSACQWARTNRRHVIGRLPLGGIPCSFGNFAIVDRVVRWPRFLSAPWIPVAPARVIGRHPVYKSRISTCTPGRPGRDVVYVHFRAINSRPHLRIVSGVTIVATSVRMRRVYDCHGYDQEKPGGP